MKILATTTLFLIACGPITAQKASAQATTATPQSTARSLPRSTTNIGDTSPGGSSLRYRKPDRRKKTGGSTRVRDMQPRESSLRYRGKSRRSRSTTRSPRRVRRDASRR
jgi:hypothetical protein